MIVFCNIINLECPNCLQGMTNNVRFTFSVVTLHGRFRIALDTIVSVTHYLGLDNAIFGFLDINNFNY